MPFTPAHVSAVIPLKNIKSGQLSFTALAIGSMVPDYEYFVRMTLYGHYGHTLPGIFLFDIPLGLFLYVLYHAIVRKPLITHLPQSLYLRFCFAYNFNWIAYIQKHFLIVLLSLLLGTLTHFIWDGFTHDEEYYLATQLRFLLHKFNIAGYSVPLYNILQGFSSILGMAILYCFIKRLPKYNGSRQKHQTIGKFWVLVFAIGVIAGSIRWLAGMPDEKLAGQIIVVSISALHIGLLITCLLFSARKTYTKSKLPDNYYGK
ncbi:DUF4184 family protein [Foetidibacter luteolus]|uniref:DUF4184 family protein n=1 Tax=Foetidibacter luteolus TaxID=2608880 RepID=UPI00129A4903|nr:DUF4184 family protein [Foetidibacter luteolus]